MSIKFGASNSIKAPGSIYAGINGNIKEVKSAYVGNENNIAVKVWEKRSDKGIIYFPTSTGTLYTMDGVNFTYATVSRLFTSPFNGPYRGSKCIYTNPGFIFYDQNAMAYYEDGINPDGYICANPSYPNGIEPDNIVYMQICNDIIFLSTQSSKKLYKIDILPNKSVWETLIEDPSNKWVDITNNLVKPTSNVPYKVFMDENKTYVSSSGTGLFTTTNFNSWTKLSTTLDGVSHNIYSDNGSCLDKAITKFNNMYIMQDSPQYVRYSYDMINWNTAYYNASLTSSYDIQEFNGMLFGANYYGIIYSEDGLNWNFKNSFSYNPQFSTIGYSNKYKKYFCAGYPVINNSRTCKIYNSTNGVDWKEIANKPCGYTAQYPYCYCI